MSLETILKKYKNIKMFEKEQYDFKVEFFKELFDPYGSIDYDKRTTLFINAILEEENLHYLFSVEEEIDEPNKGKKYWQLIVL